VVPLGDDDRRAALVAWVDERLGRCRVVAEHAWPHGESLVVVLETADDQTVVAKGHRRAEKFAVEHEAYERWVPALGDAAPRLLAADGGVAAMSGDGRYVTSTEGGTSVRLDLTDGSTVALPDFIRGNPMLSGDGSRVADSGGDADQPGAAGFRVIDVGAPAWTQLSSDPVLYATRLSRDGSHLIGTTNDGIVDWDVGARTKGIIAPLSTSLAISPNGNHVLYTPTNDPTTVLRWNR
jgi:hypothetical protein